MAAPSILFREYLSSGLHVGHSGRYSVLLFSLENISYIGLYVLLIFTNYYLLFSLENIIPASFAMKSLMISPNSPSILFREYQPIMNLIARKYGNHPPSILFREYRQSEALQKRKEPELSVLLFSLENIRDITI